MANFELFIQQAYDAFNAYDIPRLLAMLHPQVRWQRAYQGDYITGSDAVRNFWQQQWQQVETHDEPISIRQLADGRLAVSVHQLTKDKQGNVRYDGRVGHLFTFEQGLIKQLDIELG